MKMCALILAIFLGAAVVTVAARSCSNHVSASSAPAVACDHEERMAAVSSSAEGSIQMVMESSGRQTFRNQHARLSGTHTRRGLEVATRPLRLPA
jgi:hypothetical protein